MLYVMLTILLIVIDQVVKFLVRANIPLGDSVPFLPHVLELTYVQNTGAAFSLLAEHTWILTLISVLVVIVMVIALWKKVLTHPLGVVPAVLVLSGGLGNLIDRIAFGYVTDMFRTLFMNFAVFNVADICITVGAVWLAVYVLFGYEKLEKKSKKEAPSHDGTDLSSDVPEAGRADVLLAGMIDGSPARPPNGGWRRAGGPGGPSSEKKRPAGARSGAVRHPAPTGGGGCHPPGHPLGRGL